MGFIIHQEQHAHTAFALFCFFFVLCPLLGKVDIKERLHKGHFGGWVAGFRSQTFIHLPGWFFLVGG